MRLTSARALKEELKAGPIVRSVPHGLDAVRAFGATTGRLTTFSFEQPTMAIGIARRSRTDFRLAVHVQRRALLDHPAIEKIRKEAEGEVDVRYVGRISKLERPSPARSRPLTGRQRPLIIGASVGHFAITAGTIGAFVARRRGGAICILSNNHVLADENEGRTGDAIVQPGITDGGREERDTVATLATFVPLKRRRNVMDAAIARLSEGIDWEPAKLQGGGELLGVADDPDLGDRVTKVGRTSGRTRGKIVAFELDGVGAAYGSGTLSFDNCLAIEGDRTAPSFSSPGDSGSLIIRERDHLAVGLLFAGSDHGGSAGQGLTYASPLRAILNAVKVDLVV